jgi:DNA-binding NarL/FixJ family response regulator
VVTVLIVDDHAGFRARARSLLESEGYAVVGEAGDGASGFASARSLEPDVVLLDVALPDSSGFAIAEQLARLPSPPSVVLVSSRQAEDFGDVIGHSRAQAFIPKLELSGSRLREVLARSS